MFTSKERYEFLKIQQDFIKSALKYSNLEYLKDHKDKIWTFNEVNKFKFSFF